MTFTTLIDAAALRDLVGKPDVAVIDCRFDLMNPEGGRRAYLEGHIPGARYADLNQDLSAPISRDIRAPSAACPGGLRRHAWLGWGWPRHPSHRL